MVNVSVGSPLKNPIHRISVRDVKSWVVLHVWLVLSILAIFVQMKMLLCLTDSVTVRNPILEMLMVHAICVMLMDVLAVPIMILMLVYFVMMGWLFIRVNVCVLTPLIELFSLTVWLGWCPDATHGVSRVNVMVVRRICFIRMDFVSVS
jgi:hypothetical protein